MNAKCGICKYADEIKPGGQKPSPGTVWCNKRGIQMGKSREMPCFSGAAGLIRHCIDCKRAKVTKPSGESTLLGNVWCDKKKAEINKQRSMGCFE